MNKMVNKQQESLVKQGAEIIAAVSIAGLGGAAGGVAGGGTGAAVGFACAGPPGAAVGYLIGTVSGMVAGAGSAGYGATKANALIKGAVS